MLCALRAQIELGDYSSGDGDYRQVMTHCLPPRLLANIQKDHVAMHHQSLLGMNIEEAKEDLVKLLQSWSLHKATVFEVTVRDILHLVFLLAHTLVLMINYIFQQSFSSKFPASFWLAVSEDGVHLLEAWTKSTFLSYKFSDILAHTTSNNGILFITTKDKFIITTKQVLNLKF